MTSFANGAPCWADVMLPDLEAGKRFYGELLGWTFEDSGPEFGHYTSAFRDGEPVAGLMPKQDGRTPTAWTVYLATDDAAATVQKAREAGGQVIAEPMKVGEVGTMAVLSDPSGAVFGIWQPGEHKGFGKRNEPGSFCWVELRTRGSKVADPFYRQLFGYRTRQIGQAGGEMDYETWAVGDAEGPVAGRLQMGPEFPAELPPHFLLYFSVSDCDEAAETIRRLGGQVHSGPHDSPFGRIANVADDQGAAFAVIDTSTTVGEPPA